MKIVTSVSTFKRVLLLSVFVFRSLPNTFNTIFSFDITSLMHFVFMCGEAELLGGITEKFSKCGRSYW